MCKFGVQNIFKMKIRYTFSLFLLLFNFLDTSEVFGQFQCGTVDKDPSQWIKELKELGIKNPSNSALKTRATKYIPIHYHIVTKDDGSEGMPLHFLMEMHCRNNKTYAMNGCDIIFYLDKISYLPSTKYFDLTYSEGSELSKNYNTLNHCNIYLVNDPAGNGGYTQVPHPQNVAATRGTIFARGSSENSWYAEGINRVIEHEMGHWLGLPHTFSGWEGSKYGTANAIAVNLRERVARSGTNANCSTTGDLFCDTDPDYLPENWHCIDKNTFIDPLGVSFDLKMNIMSYNYIFGSDNCLPPFSQEQIARMHTILSTYNERKDLLDLPIPTGNKVDSIINLIPTTPANLNAKIIVGAVKFSFRKDPNATQYIITLAKGDSVYKSDFTFSGQNIIYDVLITDTSLSIPASLFGSSFPNPYFYYWSVRGINKLSGCESLSYNTKGQAFRVSNNASSINVDVKKTTCNNLNDGKLTISDPLSLVSTIKLNGKLIVGKDSSNLPGGNYTIEVKTKAGEEIIFNSSTYTEKVGGTISYSQPKTAKINPTGGTPPYSYFWSNGQSGQIQSNMQNGTYKAVITDANNCVSDSIHVKIDNFTGSITKPNEDEFRLYPTSIRNGEFLNFSIPMNNCTITVMTIDGKIVRSETIKNSTKFLWTSMETGLFIIHVKSENIDKSFKIEGI